MNLDEFSNYLETKHKVNKNRIPFYINWVRSFLHHCDGKIDFENPSKQIDLFLIHTGKRYEQWQVNQAQEAIRLYCYFAGKTDKNNAPKDLYSVKDWKSAGDRMIRMLGNQGDAPYIFIFDRKYLYLVTNFLERTN